MEAIGAVSTVIGLLDILANRLSEFRDRLSKFQQQPAEYNTLVATHDVICEEVNRLNSSLLDKPTPGVEKCLQLAQKHVEDANSELEKLSEHLDRVPDGQASKRASSSSRERKQGRSKWSKLAIKGRALQNTNRTDGDLSSVRSHLDLAWGVLNHIELREIRNAVSRPEGDVFVSKTRVIPNPENLVFDFDSRDENEIPVTYEGRLKDAVLRSGGSPCSPCIGVIGEGGIGKSCATRQLVQLKDVRERFTGGIYEISLGMDGGVAKLTEEVCFCVEISGGETLSKKLLVERNLSRILQKAGSWFEGHRVLFIVDDVWQNKEINLDVVHSLKMLLLHQGSHMVFTSRDSRMGNCASEVIEFETRGPFSDTSKRMLLKNAQMSENDARVRENRQHFERILGHCGGLPVALAAAGALLKHVGEMFTDPFAKVLSRMGCERRQLREHKLAGYRTLSDLLDTAVWFCEVHYGQEWSRRTEKSFEEIVQSLCVLQKQQFAPVSMLKRLWGVEDEDMAEDLIKILRNVGVLKEEVRIQNGSDILGIRLHDLVYDHFVVGAKERRSEYHAQLLNTYAVTTECGGGVNREWWIVDGDRNLYLYENLCRLLIGAGAVGEAVWLLMTPRWTVKQIRVCGTGRIFMDHLLVIGVLKTLIRQNMEEAYRTKILNTIEALECVKEAVKLAAPYVGRNGREIWFQLYGRLIERKEVYGIGEYLKEITLHAEKPWVRPGAGYLSPSGGPLSGIRNMRGGAVTCAWFGTDGSVFIIHTRHVAEVKVWRAYDDERWKCIWTIETSEVVFDCTVSDNGSKLSIYLSNGSVEVWDVIQKKRLKCEKRLSHGKGAGVFSADGNLLALHQKRKNIAIWRTDYEKMEPVCQLRNKSRVRGVCWSGDGRSVAVACGNGFVYLWNVNSRSIMNSFPVGKTKVWIHMAWSSKNMIATSYFRETCVWDVTGESVKLVFNTNERCFSLKWSDDGLRLATGGALGLTIWKADEARQMKKEYRSFKSIYDVRWSRDGKRLAAICYLGAVRVVQVSPTLEYGNSKEHWRFVRWCESGTMLATLCDDGLGLWSPNGRREAKGRLLCAENGKNRRGHAVDLAWAAEGEVLAAVYEHEVQLWKISLHKQELISVLSAPCGRKLCTAALNVDGSNLVACTDQELLFWDTKNSDAYRILAEYNDKTLLMRLLYEIERLALSDDGRFICSFDNSQLKVWDVNSGQCCASIYCGKNRVHIRPIMMMRMKFSEGNVVHIEWSEPLRNGTLKGERFGEWHWRSSSSLSVVAKRRPFVVGSELWIDSRELLGTTETVFQHLAWDYNTQGGTLAILTVHGHLVSAQFQVE